MLSIRVEIDVHYVPTMVLIGTGVQWLEAETEEKLLNELELLKDLLSESVRGSHAFLKLGSAVDEIFIGREILMQSKITIRRCEPKQK